MDNITTVENNTSQECMIFDGNQYKCNAILALRKTTASLSLIGCLFMIIVIWLFRKYTLFTHRLILYLTVAAFFASVAFLMREERPDGPLCDFEAFWTTFWSWAALSWVSCIIFNLLMLLTRMTPTEKLEIIYLLIGWGIPLLVSLLPFIGDRYGPAGAWCWIKDDTKNGTHWRFGIWYGPVIVLVILMFVANGYILWTLKRKTGVFQGTYDAEAERNKQLIDKEIKPLVAYPIVYVALYTFGLINRIQNAVDPGHPIFALVLLHAMTSPLVGAVNAVVYGLDIRTREKLNKTDMKNAMRSKRNPTSAGVIREYNVESAAADSQNTTANTDQRTDVV